MPLTKDLMDRLHSLAEHWLCLEHAPEGILLLSIINLAIGVSLPVQIIGCLIYAAVFTWMVIKRSDQRNLEMQHDNIKHQKAAGWTIVSLLASVFIPLSFKYLFLAMDFLIAGILPLLQVIEIFSVIYVLLMIVPGSKVTGYVCSFDGKPLEYTLNGLNVLIVTAAFYGFLVHTGVKDSTYLASHFIECWFWAAVIGLSLAYAADSAAQKIKPIDSKYQRCLTRDQLSFATQKDDGSIDVEPLLAKLPANNNSIWALEYFNGSFFNPRLFNVDVKMALYCLGAVMLQLNILSMVALHLHSNGGVLANAVLVYASLFTWFLIEYSYFEKVHLYTYDLFCEKVGAKLIFGCLGFYPYLYCTGGMVLSHFAPHQNPELYPTDLSIISSLLISILFFCGWTLTRGANMQKFYFKLDPTATTVFFGLVPQQTIPGSRILYSGFWGVSRHVNYLGEILQGVALALPGFLVLSAAVAAATVVDGGGGVSGWLAWVPWIYPLYYVCLFVPRERDDHVICSKKYGDTWVEYCKRVPYRIVPFIY